MGSTMSKWPVPGSRVKKPARVVWLKDGYAFLRVSASSNVGTVFGSFLGGRQLEPAKHVTGFQ